MREYIPRFEVQKMIADLSRRRKRSKGSVMVETALIFLGFSAILIGSFDFAQFLFIHQALVERTRYAARWGALSDPTNSAAITNMVLYNQSAAPPSGTSGYLGLTSSAVSVTNPGSGTDDYRLTIVISNYTYNMLSPYIAGTYTGPNIEVSVPLGSN
jgi:Flp pilus assembly protein TadG